MKLVDQIKKIQQLQNREWVNKAGKYIFCIMVLMELLIVLWDKSMLPPPPEGRLFQITFGLCLLKILSTRYERREYLVIFIAFVFGLLIDQMSGHNEVLRYFAFIASCKDIDMKKCLRWCFVITLAGIALIGLLSATGILGTMTVLKEYTGEGMLQRYCFGMGNANSFHCMIFSIAMLGMYVFEEKMHWWMYILIVAANIGIYRLTDCKTATGILILGVVAMWFIGLLKKFAGPFDETARNIWVKIVRFFLYVGSLICLAVNTALVVISSILAANAWKIYEFNWSRIEWNEDIEFWRRLNDKLTGRILSLMNTDNRAGSMLSWRWLPVEGHEEYFDLGYVRIFYWYGIIAALVIILMLHAFNTYLIIEHRYTELIFITIIALYTLLEAHFVSVYIGRCWIVFIIGAYWSRTNGVLKGCKEKGNISA